MYVIDLLHNNMLILVKYFSRTTFCFRIFNEQEPLKSDIEAELPEDSKLLVETYERCCVEDHVDVDLIVHILHNIHESGKKGILLNTNLHFIGF